MKLTQWMAAGALSLAAGVANAALITDTVQINRFMQYDDSYSWTHNINDNGFTPGSQTVNSARLAIQFRDDRHLGDGYEYAYVDINNVYSDRWFEVNTGTWGRTLGISALARLNNQGLLDIRVENAPVDFNHRNDYTIVSSTLTADVTDVPEPASLAILGLGLAGLGVARRHAKKAA